MAIEHKRGDTLTISVTDSAGDISAKTITSSVAGRGLSQGLTVTEIDYSIGQYTLSATATETADWPTGKLKCDIKYVEGATVERTETFNINVVEEITA